MLLGEWIPESIPCTQCYKVVWHPNLHQKNYILTGITQNRSLQITPLQGSTTPPQASCHRCSNIRKGLFSLGCPPLSGLWYSPSIGHSNGHQKQLTYTTSIWELPIRDNGKGHIPGEAATTQLGGFPGRKQVLQCEVQHLHQPVGSCGRRGKGHNVAGRERNPYPTLTLVQGP